MSIQPGSDPSTPTSAAHGEAPRPDAPSLDVSPEDPTLQELLNPLDVRALSEQWSSHRPTHYVCIDGLLKPDFARQVAAAYPTFDQAREVGRQFTWVNEDVKVQVTDSEIFPEPVKRLNALLASPVFLDTLSQITGIPRLLADPELAGGGIQVMGKQGHLGVHVDFNMNPARTMHRRLNIIVYLSDAWQESWGGEFELWDPRVKECLGTWTPAFNRAVMFNTTTESFHGVRAVKAPSGFTRNSFAGFYYTEEAPADWDGEFHDTIYKPRPGEWLKRVQMPVEHVQRNALPWLRRMKHRVLGER